MENLKVSVGKLETAYGFWNIRIQPDGSVVLIRYSNSEHKQTLQLIPAGNTYGYLCDERYYIDVKLPLQRDMLACVIIMRSSQNNYKAVYTDMKKSELRVCSGLEDLNGYIKQIENGLKSEKTNSAGADAKRSAGQKSLTE